MSTDGRDLEPGKPGVLDVVMEYMYPVLMEDLTRSQECHHVKEGELVLVDQC